MQRVLYSGIPGTSITKTYRKVASHIRSLHGSHSVITSCLEDKLVELAPKHFRPPEVWDRDFIPPILQVLQLPIEELEILYSEAWKEVFREEELEDNKRAQFHLIASHLSLSIPNTREFICLTKATHFEGYPISRIIVLIDDVYDVHGELCKHYFSYGTLKQENAQFHFTQYISHLLSVLRWRESEISSSLQLKSALDNSAKCYFAAVKHDVPTLAELSISNKPIAYISHPITALRDRSLQSEESRAFIDELTAFVTALQKHYIVLQPTTIDELRFSSVKRVVKSGSGHDIQQNIILPNLTERWPLLGQAVQESAKSKSFIFSSPEPELSVVENFIKDRLDLPELTELLDSLLDEIFSQSLSMDRNKAILLLGGYVGILTDAIQEQITSRDLHLVQQADRLIVFRPFYNGGKSGGVETEINHFNRLINYSRSQLADRKICRIVPRQDSEAILSSALKDLVNSDSSAFLPIPKDTPVNGKVGEKAYDWVVSRRENPEGDHADSLDSILRGLSSGFVPSEPSTLRDSDKIARARGHSKLFSSLAYYVAGMSSDPRIHDLGIEWSSDVHDLTILANTVAGVLHDVEINVL